MKTMPISLKNKILPLAVTAVLTAGTLTSYAKTEQNRGESIYDNKVEQLSDSLDSLRFQKADKTIDFQDYYIKSKAVIKNASLDKDECVRETLTYGKDNIKELRKQAQKEYGFKSLIALAIAFTAALISLGAGESAYEDSVFEEFGDPDDLTDEKTHKMHEFMWKAGKAVAKGATLIAVLLNLVPLATPNKYFAEQYVDSTKERFEDHKSQKLEELNSEKESYLLRNSETED